MSGRISSETGDFIEGGSDDVGKADIGEHLGARHKDNFGYTTTGAQINDQVIAEKGRAPLHFDLSRRQSMGGRVSHFNHGVVGGIVG